MERVCRLLGLTTLAIFAMGSVAQAGRYDIVLMKKVNTSGPTLNEVPTPATAEARLWVGSCSGQKDFSLQSTGTILDNRLPEVSSEFSGERKGECELPVEGQITSIHWIGNEKLFPKHEVSLEGAIKYTVSGCQYTFTKLTGSFVGHRERWPLSGTSTACSSKLEISAEASVWDSEKERYVIPLSRCEAAEEKKKKKDAHNNLRSTGDATRRWWHPHSTLACHQG